MIKNLKRAFRLLITLISAFTTVSDGSEGTTYELENLEVVSTGTRTERLATEVPIRTEVMSNEFFKVSGARDLASALEYLPGARVEANCSNCGTAEIKLLGLGSGYNRLLIDSQPLFSGLASVYGLEQIPTSSVERIEIVKGGASSLYGPGAVAGVINILPREPVINSGFADTIYESVDGQPFASATAAINRVSELGNAAASLQIQVNHNDSVDLNDDGFSEITKKDFQSIGGQTWFYPTDNSKLSLNYNYSWEKRRGGDRFDLLPHESQITEELEHRWHRGGISYEGGNASELFYKISASTSIIDRDSYYGGVGNIALPGDPNHDPIAYQEELENARLLYGYSKTSRYYIDTLFSKSIAEHYFSWGAQYQYDDVFDEKRDEQHRPLKTDGTLAAFLGEDPIAHDNFSNLGAYLQDEWSPNSQTSVIIGLRADKHSQLESWIASPRAALRYSASKDWTFRASVATGFRAPEIFDEDFHIEILDDPTRTRNAADLKEESSISYTTGFVWTPASFQNRLQTDVELFKTDLSDTFYVSDIVQFDENGNPYKERANTDGSTISGIEANALYRFTNEFSAEIGLNYTDARFDSPQEVLPGVFTRRYLETPELSGTVQLTYSKPDDIDVFLAAVYTGPMLAAKESEGILNTKTDDFLVLDFTVTKHLNLHWFGKETHMEIMLGVRNIFDQRQKDLGFGPDRDTTYFYGPRFPRSFISRASFKF